MALVAVNGENRRGKTVFFLIVCGVAGLTPHCLVPIARLFPAITLALILGGYGLQTILRFRTKANESLSLSVASESDEEELPFVDVIVSARDEETVVTKLVERLAAIKYPENKISILIVDDGSQDRTLEFLKKASRKFSNINIVTRSSSLGGGKSGALNFALDRVSGEWLFILDADAQVQEDILIRAVKYAQSGNWSAVQLRKAVLNVNQNLLTCFQSMEMAMDAVIQKGRLESKGVAELRGNGQLLQRKIIDQCGGFNENTVTDDLDLSFRLIASGASIGILWNPPVQEEAVQTLSALFKQRKRWAEGGLQRFFDYWHYLISRDLTFYQKRDIAFFFLLQYALPIVSLIDLLASLILGTAPLYWPLSFVALIISAFAIWSGCKQTCEGPKVPRPKPFILISSVLYLIHWFIVIPFVTIKMALFPKRLKWSKTIHVGT